MQTSETYRCAVPGCTTELHRNKRGRSPTYCSEHRDPATRDRKQPARQCYDTLGARTRKEALARERRAREARVAEHRVHTFALALSANDDDPVRAAIWLGIEPRSIEAQSLLEQARRTYPDGWTHTDTLRALSLGATLLAMSAARDLELMAPRDRANAAEKLERIRQSLLADDGGVYTEIVVENP